MNRFGIHTHILSRTVSTVFCFSILFLFYFLFLFSSGYFSLFIFSLTYPPSNQEQTTLMQIAALMGHALQWHCDDYETFNFRSEFYRLLYNKKPTRSCCDARQTTVPVPSHCEVFIVQVRTENLNLCVLSNIYFMHTQTPKQSIRTPTHFYVFYALHRVHFILSLIIMC